MNRIEFRRYFSEDQRRRHARFDRRGFAEVGCPLPTVDDAKRLVGYIKVRRLELQLHSDDMDTESMRTLLEGWQHTLERLSVVDHRYDAQPEPRRYPYSRVLTDCHRSIAGLEQLWDIKVLKLSVGKPMATALSTLPNLKCIDLDECNLTPAAFTVLEDSQSLELLRVYGCSGVYSEDVDLLSRSFRERCKVAIVKY